VANQRQDHATAQQTHRADDATRQATQATANSAEQAARTSSALARMAPNMSPGLGMAGTATVEPYRASRATRFGPPTPIAAMGYRTPPFSF
jgi:hypothetical protein